MPTSRSLGHPRILLGFALVASTVLFAAPSLAARITVPLDLYRSDIVETIEGGEAVLDFAGAYHLREEGELKLPTRRFEVVIGIDEEVTSVRIEGGRRVLVRAIEGVAVQGQLWSDEGKPAMLANFDASSPSEMFPVESARLASDSFVHGYHIVGVEAYPVRTLDGQVWMIEGGQVVVETGPRTDLREPARRQRVIEGWASKIEKSLRERVVNPQDLEFAGGPDPVVISEQIEAPNARRTPSLSTSPVRHLIITTTALAPEFQRLADHRTAMGLPSLVVTLADILANYRQGLDTAETIRDYIIDAYEKWGVDYVLLGGDTEIIPTRHVYSLFYPAGSFTNIPTDLYYGGLDGNWNVDGDGFFGEPFKHAFETGDFVDFEEEVSVGRATVSLVSEASAFVDKVIAFEIPTTTDYQTNVTMAAEVLFPSNWTTPGQAIQLDGAQLAESLIDSSFTTCGDSAWSIERYYQNYTAYPGALDESRATVSAALNAGTTGVFHHIGHGFYFNMSVGSGSLVPTDADALTNAPNYFVLYSMNCSSSAFDFNCLNERFLRNENGGSVISIGASRAAFPSAAGPVQEEFYTKWFCDTPSRVGDVVAASRAPFLVNTFYNTAERWTQFVYALLGDPATMLWKSTPREVAVLAPADHPMDGTPLTLSVMTPDSTLAEPGVTVTARKGSETYAIGVTDGAGQVTLDVVPETLGQLEIWTSGVNTVPFNLTIDVLDAGVGTVRTQSLGFSDDSVGASIGNGNGYLEGGETIEIIPLLKNGSTAAYAGGNAVVSTTDPWVTILDANAAVPVIGGQSSQFSIDPWVVALDPGTPDAHEVTFSITVTPGPGGSTTDEEVVVLAAPEIEVTDISVDDSLYGDGNGIADIGERVQLSVTMKNFGSGAAEGLTGTVTLASGLGTINVPSTTWPVASGVLQSVTSDPGSPLEITANDSIPLVLFDLTITDSAGRGLTHRFDLSRPLPPTNLSLASGGPGTLTIRWDPTTSADATDYRVYRKDPGAPDYILVSPDIIRSSATFKGDGLFPLSVYEFAVAAVDSGRVSSALSLPFAATTYPPEIACFPLALGLETSGALAVGEVDHDWVDDIVVGADYVYVLDANCNEKTDGDGDSQTIGPVNALSGRFHPAGIALGDLDKNNTGMEIVATNRDTRELFVLDDQGNVLPGWPKVLQNWAWGSPVVADLENDGDLEVLINDLSGFTYAFHHDGTEVADGDANPGTYGVIAPQRKQVISSTNYYESFGRTTPALFDVDGDGGLEIIFGSKYQNLNAPEFFYALKSDGSGGNAAGWPKQLAPRSEFLASPTIADLENDGVFEIIAPCENDSLYVWDQYGNIRAGFPIYRKFDSIAVDSLTPSPAVGDFDEDGTLEIVFAAIVKVGTGDRRSYLEIINADGTSWPGWPIEIFDLSESSPLVADLDGDGSLDVLYGVGGTDVDDHLYAFDKFGADLAGFPIPVDGFLRASATIGDIDGDGSVNVVMAGWDRLLHAWDLLAPFDENKAPWTTFRGNVNRTGVLGQVIRTPAPPAPKFAETQLHPAMPNPFNPATELRFELPEAASNVQLSIYDAQGRRVRVLHQGDLGVGEHRMLWTGTDQRGESVASGVYYARLSVDGVTRGTRKLALVK